MGTLAQQARGANKPVTIAVIIIAIALGACQTKQVKPTPAFHDLATLNITVKGGITYSDTVPLSGVLFLLNEKADTVFAAPYINGKKHGISREYYPDGKIKSSRYYRNGWKEGEHNGWFANGSPRFVYHFRDDMFEGNQKEWLENGMLYSDLNFEKGMESGRQRVWNPNGTIKSNYIIKNDRRYGLLGTKNCVNTSDSVFSRL